MRNLFLLLLFGVFSSVKGQTLKSDVFIVGNSNVAVAAAIQAAQSNVKTVLLLQAGGFDIAPLDKDLHSGIQLEFLKKIKFALKQNDSLVDVTFDKLLANEVLKVWTDSVKNLTVIKDVYWTKTSRANGGWLFKLNDGRSLRSEVLVNVADEKLNGALKITNPINSSWQQITDKNTFYKTNIAAGKLINGSNTYGFSLYQLLQPNADNYLYLPNTNSFLLGQSVGAVAAYAGFFNRKISEAKLREIQGELLAFKLNIIPFADVANSDPNWKAIQMVGITGVIQGAQKLNELYFLPDQILTTAAVKEGMKAHFYKAQIWFDDYKSDEITLAAALDMLCYTGNKALESTKEEVQKKWNTAYKFNSPYNLQNIITRRQFAVLLQDLCPPFNVTINKDGKILR